MSSSAIDLYPIVVVEDRYGGVYAGGAWWAVAAADTPLDGQLRVTWLMNNGPNSDDVCAATFWGQAPSWIASGATPDAAVAKVSAQACRTDDDWSPLSLNYPWD